MPFTTKIEITFDRDHLAPNDDIQFYRVYRKKNAIPERLQSELVFLISQPISPENTDDTIIRLDSELPQTGVAYDPLEQINEADPRGASYTIAIDDSLPVPPTNLIVIPDPNNNQSDIGGILIQWTASGSVGTIWGYDVTAIDSGGLESPEGAVIATSQGTKLETIDIGLADGVTPVPSEYPLSGQVFNTYVVDGGSQTFVSNGQTSILDDNNGLGWDTDGPNGVGHPTAVGNFSDRAITLRWNETLKNIGTNLSARPFRVNAFTKAGYSNTSIASPGPNSIICPITNGFGGVTITRTDSTRWHDGVTLKMAAPPGPHVLIVPSILEGILNLPHGSIIKGSVTVTDVSGQIIYIEDSGTFNSPNFDGDYLIEYSRFNGTTDVGSRIKILSSGIIQAGQQIHIQYKFGVDFGNNPHSIKPTLSDTIIGLYDGTVWSGTGSQIFIDNNIDTESAYTYAWFVTDNAGRTTHDIKYAQGILENIVFPGPITNFKVESINI